MAAKREKLYLVDASSYIFRAYYAIQPLSTSKGLPTNALYGFVRMLLKLMKEERPDRLAVVFDTVEPTFRDELFKDYKANREEPPDDLVPQFPYFGPIVEALGIKKLSKPGYEADDVIGTVAKKAEDKGYYVTIVTGDKDFMQLVCDHIELYDTMKERRVGRAEVREKFGVDPERVVDVMSLIGDSSDNIPGVNGIGPKGAAALINQFGSLDNLLSGADEVLNIRFRNALKSGRGDAELSRELATIRLDVPIKFHWKELEITELDKPRVKEIFSELEFFKLIREMIPADGKEPHPDCRIASSQEDLKALAKGIGALDRLAVYFIEGRKGAVHPYLGLAVAWSEKDAAYIPIGHATLEEVANVSFHLLKEFLGSLQGKEMLIYDAKEVIRYLGRNNVLLGPRVVDVKLMAYVVNPSYPADLATLAQQVLGVRPVHSGLTEGKESSKGKKAEFLMVREAAERSECLAGVVLQLVDVFNNELSKNAPLNDLFTGVETPLSYILAKMEERGVRVDVEILKTLSKEYTEKISKLEKKIYKEAGEAFTIASPKQLSYILFEKLGLPAVKKTKTGYSTDAHVLAQLAVDYELPAYILGYRSLTKLKSTYIDVLPTLVDPKTGRIHTTFNQSVAATGRLSSSDPNLQNIPARSEEGLRIRRAFIPCDGMKFLSADYSQIELRILAHISGDKRLIEAFRNGVDVHRATASQIFGVEGDKVDGKMRAAAKTVNFGVLYGQGAYGLAQQLDIDVAEADTYIKDYYRGYPLVARLKEDILKGAEANGYVETLFGRRRYVPDINSKNNQAKALAERTAFNAVFQGTAADIIKKAMLDVDRILKMKFPDSAMLLQVHDELVFETPPEGIDELKDAVRNAMCGVVDLKVPLEVDIGVGDNWAECK